MVLNFRAKIQIGRCVFPDYFFWYEKNFRNLSVSGQYLFCFSLLCFVFLYFQIVEECKGGFLRGGGHMYVGGHYYFFFVK